MNKLPLPYSNLHQIQVERLKQEKNTAKDNAHKLEKKLRDATSEMNQVKQKQDKTNRARDALKAQVSYCIYNIAI